MNEVSSRAGQRQGTAVEVVMNRMLLRAVPVEEAVLAVVRGKARSRAWSRKIEVVLVTCRRQERMHDPV